MTYDILNISLHQFIKDNSLDQTFVYQLMANVINDIETSRNWSFLKAADKTQTTASSDTYTTFRAFPSDFGSVEEVILTPIGGATNTGLRLVPIPWERREFYSTVSGYYYMDYANSQYALTGTNQANQTIVFSYIKKSSDPTAANAATASPLWPSKFHFLIVYRMAERIFGGIDGDAINLQMYPIVKAQGDEIFRNMKLWDMKQRMLARDNTNRAVELDNTKREKVFNLDSETNAQ